MSGILQTLFMPVTNGGGGGIPPEVFDSGFADSFADDMYIASIPENSIVYCIATTESLSDTPTITGFTSLGFIGGNPDGYSIRTAVLYKVYATAETDVFLKPTAGTARCSGAFIVITGADTSTPVFDEDAGSFDGGSNDPIPNAIECPANGIVMIFSSSSGSTNSVLVQPSEYSDYILSDVGWKTTTNEFIIAFNITAYTDFISNTAIGTITRTDSGDTSLEAWTSKVVVVTS